ncbi:MAG: T9SS type A sorting domain-containing protein, partial [Bacteroidales bacterium]|nr:T9SS type A sorting domain-containing protein [Bacteroidales bacterium]
NNEMVMSHGIWNNDDFDVDIFAMECIVQPASTVPANQKIEFSPDGQIGYIVVLADNGEIDISKDQSYYPIIWRTEDGGATWSDPIAVAVAGEDGIGGVQNYLSDEEIAELFVEPLPERNEIPFTTAFDCDLSVDMYGNPHIAVVCGVTSSTPYAILSGISPSSGYAFTSMFLLSSSDLGNEGSWIGYELGRPVSFRGTFGEFTEDNRIQIARDPAGTKMFVSWLDTDTTVSSENNAPDIWTRGVDVVNHKLTVDENGDDLPSNVTFGSEGTFSAYIFAMANEVFDDGLGNYTVPFVYLNMNPADPTQQVQYKYVQDFQFSEADFIITDIGETQIANTKFTEISQTMPNPASTVARFDVTLNNTAGVSVIVTNMMGQTVKTIPAKTYLAGTSSIAIQVSDLTSGVYFYTVSAGKETITKKMIEE